MEETQIGTFSVAQVRDDNGLGWNDRSGESEKQVDLRDKENTWI